MSIGAFAGRRAGAPFGAGIARRLRAIGAAVRFDEVAILQGTPLLGALFAPGGTALAALPALALLLAGSGLLVAHVFLLNDRAGLVGDRRDPHRAPPAAVSRRTLGRLGRVALLSALLLLSPFGAPTVGLALAIAGLSALYSVGPRPAKGVPVLASCLHVAGGMLHFHLGWACFAAPDPRSTALSAFFGLTFAAGHLVQEVRDHDADRSNGIRTSAVAFGRTSAFAAGVALFALADVLLLGLAAGGVVPRVLALAGPCFVLHLSWSLRTLGAGLTHEAVRRFRGRYRRLYVVVGLLMLAAAVSG